MWKKLYSSKIEPDREGITFFRRLVPMKQPNKKKSLGIRILKIAGFTLAGIVALLLLIAGLIQLPYIQNKLKDKATAFLEKKIGTTVELNRIAISFPENIVLEGLYMEDQSGDTLLSVGKIFLDTDLWALTRNEIVVDELTISETRAKVSREESDSAYNFSYIIEAFASKDSAVADTTSSSWTFAINQLGLEQFRVSYADGLAGNFAEVDLGDFNVEMKTFDLEAMRIEVEQILLANSSINFSQTKVPEVTEEVAEENQPITYDIGVGKIQLDKVRTVYDQKALGQSAVLNIGHSALETKDIDLKSNKIALAAFSLTETQVSYTQRAGYLSEKEQEVQDPEPAAEKKSEQQPWSVTLDELMLDENSVSYHDSTKSKSGPYDNIDLTDLTIRASDISSRGIETQIQLDELSFASENLLTLKEFSGDFNIANDQVRIADLIVRTEGSSLKGAVAMSFPSISEIIKKPEASIIRQLTLNAVIKPKEFESLVPAIQQQLPQFPGNATVRLAASAKGSLDDLTMQNFSVQALDDTYLRASGRVQNVLEPDDLMLQLTINQLFTSKFDLRRIIGDNRLPDSINIPDWIRLKGNYHGGTDAGDFLIDLRSQTGQLFAKGRMNLDSTSASSGIQMSATATEIQLGKILQQQALGNFSAKIDADLKGSNVNTMSGAINGIIASFDYNGYEYNNLKLNVTATQGVYNATTEMADTNLNFTLKAKAAMNQTVAKYAADLELRQADFQALKLSERPLKTRGNFKVSVAMNASDIQTASLDIRKAALFNGDDIYTIDSLLFATLDQQGQSEITIDSDLLSGKFEGSFNIQEIGVVLQNYLNNYYHTGPVQNQSDSIHQHFRFDLKLHKTELITQVLLPELKSFVPGTIHGEFDSRSRNLDMRIDVEDILYNNIGIKSVVFSTNSDSIALNYNIFLDSVSMDTMLVHRLELNGSLRRDSVLSNVMLFDSVGKTKYLVGASFFSPPNREYVIKIDPNSFVLNYVSWAVDPNNLIRITPDGIRARNVVLKNQREQIALASLPDSSKLKVSFRELNLNYLTSMVTSDQLVSGLLHGDVVVDQSPDGAFTADANIQDLNFFEVNLGNMALRVSQTSSVQYDVDFSLIGPANDVRVDGFYQAGENPSMDLTAIIKSIQLESLQPFLGSQVQDIKGVLSANIKASGSPSKPEVRGELRMNDVAFTPEVTNSTVNIRNEKIEFNEQGIVFNEFTIEDSKTNKAQVNGSIQTTDYSDFKLDLSLATRNFRLIDTRAGQNEMFFGRVDVNADVQVTGNLTQPSINVSASLGEGSELTYIVPQTEAGILEQEGIVRFVDKTFKDDPMLTSINPADTIETGFSGFNLTARIELNDTEKFTVIIDPTTEDQLTVRGNTTLTLNMDPTGDMQLTGRYEITEGKYNLSFYKFLKREFDIESGSVISWSGDPLNADMDIRAIYNIETAPIDLVQSVLAGADQQEINRYKQRLPFQVYLLLKGQLLKPEVSFRVDMPEQERNAMGGNIYARIQDLNTRESDLNKQVFALLILKRFISDNPFQTESGQGVEGTARSSVSKILSQQLNRLSQNVKGVELSFDVKSSENFESGTGQNQTQLQLGLQKNLFNERLVVKLAGNVDIEGTSRQDEVTDYIGDLALEYRLTEDGRFRITGFRNSDYDMIDGELTETGAGLIYIKDYNLLSELFKANKSGQRKK